MSLSDTYLNHVHLLQQLSERLLEAEGFDALLIHSGSALGRWRDDQQHPFQANPYFRWWLPLRDREQGWLLIRAGRKPWLAYYNPLDYWHMPAGAPDGFWVDSFEVQSYADPAELDEMLKGLGRCALLAEQPQQADRWGAFEVNPPRLIHGLDWQRSYKSDYELACLREASALAVKGHRAAFSAWREGGSEFSAHLAYLAATGQREPELPYGNIVAFNEHAAVLHYQHLDQRSPRERHGLLVDAGADVRGYAADITRTWATGGLFAELIAALDSVQQKLCAQVKAGVCFVDLHQKTHLSVGLLLESFGLVDMDPASQVAAGVTRCFFPHGLGHLLGLQVHDVAGKVSDDRGAPLPAPAEHPFLRLTRPLATGMVLTIEPGIYFIPSLLAELRRSPAAGAVNWGLVEALLPCGGIRIEDNLWVTGTGAINLTREAFAVG